MYQYFTFCANMINKAKALIIKQVLLLYMSL
nr:MAG TPA: hypothetical protein [Caudoviricetes sp.]